MRYALLLVVLIAFASILSWVATYGFWIGVWLFHSVSAARLCEGVGAAILLPARCLLPLLGDQSTPLFQPLWYAAVNGTALGTIIHLCIGRRVLQKVSERSP